MTVRGIVALVGLGVLWSEAPVVAGAQATVGVGRVPTSAQTAQPTAHMHEFEVGAGYEYLHSNASPGGCSCFSLNGGELSASMRVLPSLSAAFDLGITHAGNVFQSGESLTLTTYTAGPRYKPHLYHDKVQPFAEMLSAECMRART